MKPRKIKQKKDLSVETVEEYKIVEELNLKYKVVEIILKYGIIASIVLIVSIVIYAFTKQSDATLLGESFSSITKILTTILEAAIK